MDWAGALAMKATNAAHVKGINDLGLMLFGKVLTFYAYVGPPNC